MHERDKLALFERAIMPHLKAAYNLARWLAGNDQDAEDVVQEASLRAFRSIAGFHGQDGRAWFLTIVRNAAYTSLHRNQARDLTIPFDDGLRTDQSSELTNPETLVLHRLDVESIAQAIANLPPGFREILVLREMEDLSYKEIADISGLPIGTVMSRLARARKRIQGELSLSSTRELQREL